MQIKRTMKQWKITLLMLALAAGTVNISAKAPKNGQEKIRVACVGNSVTYGYLLENREHDCYPAVLQRLLGDGYEVGNFGHSGATLLNHGHRPYTQTQEYTAAVAYAADLVVIHLGLNDTDPRNWPNYNDDFINDYLALIDTFRKVNPTCRIWICRMTPIFHAHPRFKSGTRDWFQLEQQAITNVAAIADVPLIDLHPNLYCRPDLFPDALHPAPEGAAILAKTVYSALTGDYGGLQMPDIYSDGMVLQRNTVLRIAGRANAGEQVTVRFRGRRAKTVTRPNGTWEVLFEPFAASFEPAVLEIATPTRKLVYRDVLTGDVWLCSGQSNMAFMVNQCCTENRDNLTAYAAGAPAIRLYDMKPNWLTNDYAWERSALDSTNRLQYFHQTAWTHCTPESAGVFSAVGFAFGRMLADSLQVPIGLISNAVGGSPTEAWIDRATLETEFDDILRNWKNNDFIQDWVRARGRSNTRLNDTPLQRHPYEPCYLFEAGILPLERFPLKGVIWYQGESNAHNIEAHERLFPLLLKSWRHYWGEELPFYYVQLSGIERPSWPQFRDSQRRMMYTLGNTGMAVCSDLGDPYDVHPRQKQPVGERLARWALHDTYGFGQLVPSGPLFRSAEKRGDAVYVSFDHAAGLQTSDGQALRTFELAEYDGYFFPADATILTDGTVEVQCPQVAHPKYVRYAWQPYTDANLVNAERLPASTFKAPVSEPEQTPYESAVPRSGGTPAIR